MKQTNTRLAFWSKMAFLYLLFSHSYIFVMAQASFNKEKVISTTADRTNFVYPADLDNDGDIDILATTYFFNSKIVWYENDGSGNFGEEQVITNDINGANTLYTADLDNDGNIDVLSSSWDDNKIAWYKNEGNGNFGPQQIIGNAYIAKYVFAADLNNDTYMDVLSTSLGYDEIAWYENDGNGNFSTAQIVDTELDMARCVHTADLDNDNDNDIIANGWFSSGGGLFWYENDGNGNFGTRQTIGAIGGIGTIHSVDLDIDDDVDILVASFLDGTIWYENDGNGNFGDGQTISTHSGNATSVSTADLDKDGDIDIISSYFDGSKIAWYENDGNQNFSEEQILSINAVEAKSVAAADLDKDGDIDIVSASQLDDKVAWYENTLALDMFVYENNELCLSNDIGSLQVQLSGSLTNPPYNYILSDGTNTINDIITTENFAIPNLAAGIYSISVTNVDGDKAVETDIELTGIASDFFEITNITSTKSTNEFSNGILQITVGGGFSPYTYTWSGATSGSEMSFENTYKISNLYAGNYAVTITDINGNMVQCTSMILDETLDISICQEPLDILILNDVSSSVDSIEYAESKLFFVDFINALNIGTATNETRVGIIEWSVEQDLIIPLTKDLATLQNYINHARAFEDETLPQEALTYGYNYLETETLPNVPKILIIATDGMSMQVRNIFIALAEEYKTQAYIISTIGIDQAFSGENTQNLLQNVASSEMLALGATSYSLLNNNLAETIINLYCPFGLGESKTIDFNRDGILEISSHTLKNLCPNPESITLKINITAQQLSLPAGTPITFYYNNPNLFNSTPITTYYIPCAIFAGETETITITFPISDATTNVWAVLNDDGSQMPPISFPITNIDETIYTNNLDKAVVCIDSSKALIPNAFSPNEDSVNDNFGLVFPTENVSDFYMMVYNRWGNEVFNSNDVAKKWNGNYQNENCEMGIYVYLISFMIDGERKTYKGSVSLIR